MFGGVGGVTKTIGGGGGGGRHTGGRASRPGRPRAARSSKCLSQSSAPTSRSKSSASSKSRAQCSSPRERSLRGSPSKSLSQRPLSAPRERSVSSAFASFLEGRQCVVQTRDKRGLPRDGKGQGWCSARCDGEERCDGGLTHSWSCRRGCRTSGWCCES